MNYDSRGVLDLVLILVLVSVLNIEDKYRLVVILYIPAANWGKFGVSWMLEVSEFSGKCDGLEDLGLLVLGLFLPMNLLVKCWRGVDIRHSYNKAQY